MSITAPNIGVVVTTSEVAPPSGVPTNTATAFIVGRCDWGPANAPIPVNSLTQFIAQCCDPTATSPSAARTTTNAAVFDAVDTMCRLGVPQIYVGRVVGLNPVNASLTLNDSGAHPTLVVTADYPGEHGNSIYVAVATSGGNFTITLQDSLGNVLVTSPTFATQAAAIAWSATAPYVTLTAATASGFTTNNPVNLTATPLAGGTGDFTNATLTQYQNALNLFPQRLGPGQVLAPGQTNTTLNGIWSTLLFHAQANNRFACMDVDSNTRAGQISSISAINTAAYATYGIFDQPSAIIPGVTPGTTRNVAASAVRAALCARVDADGNPNEAAAGRSYPIPYVIGFNWYGGTQTSDPDVLLLNQAGINTYLLRYGVFESFGFSTPVPPTADPIYWQASHSRLRMALVADAYSVGEPFVFGQIDGKGVEINAFGTAISSMLNDFYQLGALYGATPSDAFSVNVGPTVNTPTTIAAGELKASVGVRMSPFAQMVEIDLAAVPTTQTLP